MWKEIKIALEITVGFIAIAGLGLVLAILVMCF